MNIDFSKIEMRVSRTEQKKAHERLQALAIPLANLPKKHWDKLPVSEYFLLELKQLVNISTATAKNRQIKRIGNLIAEEDRHALIAALYELIFDEAQKNKINTWRYRLDINDDNSLKQFVKQFKVSEYNTLYQLLLWIEYAKFKEDNALLNESQADFESYLKEVAILSKN